MPSIGVVPWPHSECRFRQAGGRKRQRSPPGNIHPLAGLATAAASRKGSRTWYAGLAGAADGRHVLSRSRRDGVPSWWYWPEPPCRPAPGTRRSGIPTCAPVSRRSAWSRRCSWTGTVRARWRWRSTAAADPVPGAWRSPEDSIETARRPPIRPSNYLPAGIVATGPCKKTYDLQTVRPFSGGHELAPRLLLLRAQYCALILAIELSCRGYTSGANGRRTAWESPTGALPRFFGTPEVIERVCGTILITQVP